MQFKYHNVKSKVSLTIPDFIKGNESLSTCRYFTLLLLISYEKHDIALVSSSCTNQKELNFPQ